MTFNVSLFPSPNYFEIQNLVILFFLHSLLQDSNHNEIIKIASWGIYICRMNNSLQGQETLKYFKHNFVCYTVSLN